MTTQDDEKRLQACVWPEASEVEVLPWALSC